MEDNTAMLQLAEAISDKANEKVQEKQQAEVIVLSCIIWSDQKAKWAKIESKQQKKDQQKKKQKKLLNSMIEEVKQDNGAVWCM